MCYDVYTSLSIPSTVTAPCQQTTRHSVLAGTLVDHFLDFFKPYYGDEAKLMREVRCLTFIQVLTDDVRVVKTD